MNAMAGTLYTSCSYIHTTHIDIEHEATLVLLLILLLLATDCGIFRNVVCHFEFYHTIYFLSASALISKSERTLDSLTFKFSQCLSATPYAYCCPYSIEQCIHEHVQEVVTSILNAKPLNIFGVEVLIYTILYLEEYSVYIYATIQ